MDPDNEPVIHPPNLQIVDNVNSPLDAPGPSSNQNHGNEVLMNADGIDDDRWNEDNICRVCRFSGEEQAQPLFHPCLCTGSIKYVHQSCLLEWLKYSKKDVCELCNHKFTFKPVYREDMPERLPVLEIANGLFKIIKRYTFLFLTYCLAIFCWLGIVPLIACRVHRMVFEGNILNSFSNLYSLNMNSVTRLLSPEHIAVDILQGSTIVGVFLCTFILLVFLREQIVNGGPPELFNLDNANADQPDVAAVEPAQAPIQALGQEINGLRQDVNRFHEAIDRNGAQIDNLAARFREMLERNFDDRPEAVPHAVDEHDIRNAEQEFDANAAGLDEILNRMDIVADDNPGEHHQDQGEDGEQVAVVDAAAEVAVQANPEAENWRDVERIVEDLTWQRLLGLDGSLVFIEHVVWMISLNVIFIVVLMFMPSKLGEFFLQLMNVSTKGVHFENIINFAAGYMLVIVAVVIAHKTTRFLRIKDAYWLLGFLYLMLKVSLLITLEIFVFPFFCGWWLDICSLPLTGSTLSSRLRALSEFPVASLFVHWLVGMIDVFYSASFVLVLRELLRPGVLWFVRDLNDPEFQPIQEMIEQSFVRHFRRLVASTTLFFGIIFIMIYLPLRLVMTVVPSILPYAFSLSNESLFGEFSFELILLQFVLPQILEHASASTIMKAFVIEWCKVVGGWLGLAEYLLPATAFIDLPAEAIPQIMDAPAHQNDADSDSENGEDSDNEPAVEVVPEPPAPEHDLLRNAPDTFPKPSYFGVRILTLLFALSVTGILMSFTLFVLPVAMGRAIVYFMLNSKNPNDMYTVALGLYIVWLFIKAWIVTRMWIQQGWGVICSAAAWLGRVFVVAIPLGIIIPYMIGVYFQLLVVGPLRVAAHQTPLYFPFKDWAMGIVHFKLFCASVFLGPDWWLKAAFERLYDDGVRNYRLGLLYMQVVLPVITFISFLMCFPYVLGSIIAISLGLEFESKLTLIRYMYPATVSVFLLVLFVAWQWKKLKKLANKIRNDKYLIGTQLVNFYRESQLKLKQN